MSPPRKASEQAQWDKIATEIRDIRQTFGKKTQAGERRTDFAEAPDIDIDALFD